jgi:hypothetical protein
VSQPGRLTEAVENRFWEALHHAARFFMGDADVQRAIEKLARTLDAQGIPYAIIGAMALNEFGYRRVTVDVNVLLTLEGFAAFKAMNLGAATSRSSPGAVGFEMPSTASISTWS